MENNHKFVFDVGGSSIKYIHFDDMDIEIEKQEIEYEGFKKEEKKELRYILNLILNKIKNIEFKFDLGIALPGIIDNTNYLIKTDSTIIDVNIKINDFFSNIKNINKLIIENDAKAAAFAEFKVRNLKDQSLSNLVHVTIGTAIGGGIIINKKIYSGTKKYAGELSKLFSTIYDDNSTVYEDISTTQNCLRYKRKEINGIELMNLYIDNEPAAIEIVNEWINKLSKFLLNLDYLYAPDLITIGGGICNNELFISTLFKKYYENRIEKNIFSSKVEKAHFFNDAGCYGIKYLLDNEL
ncbi:ROK family protein [Spiroplasma culicicola]|uniref:Transcriptional regulator n=1 Tax=Spiroplasma culicicola AES-1 TaxID=1276246 RepID=W6A733_9MOLU|nr:ROK family protein [Spiroplasma culicicola]AHI52797.1 transcriptional regulator [Spiroplasma culicicola AES-1]